MRVWNGIVLSILQMNLNFKIVTVDLRGFGESSYNTHAKSMTDFSNDLAELVQVLSLKNVTICGWSLGGAVAMQFAADHGELID